MKKISILVLLFFFSFIIFSACEKDDICVDGDTPLLVVSFYNVTTETEKKTVPLLRITGIGNTIPIDTLRDRTSTIDSIGIPLKIDDTTTSFAFITNSEDDDMGVETGNIDTLTFRYTKRDVFISRACGFVANYDNLTGELTTDTDNWIKEIEIINTTVENQAAAHVKIFH